MILIKEKMVALKEVAHCDEMFAKSDFKIGFILILKNPFHLLAVDPWLAVIVDDQSILR